jgi:hypothetical protein
MMEENKNEEDILNYLRFDETEDIFSSLANSQRLAILYIILENKRTLISWDIVFLIQVLLKQRKNLKQD